MSYFYGVMFLIIALMLIFRFSKDNKIFIPLGIYFVVFSIWWILEGALKDVQMFGGIPGITIRVISAIALIICGVFYYRRNKEAQASNETTEVKSNKSKDDSGLF